MCRCGQLGVALTVSDNKKGRLHKCAPLSGVVEHAVKPGPVVSVRVGVDVLQRGLVGQELRARQRLACVRAPVVAHRSLGPMASSGQSPSFVDKKITA